MYYIYDFYRDEFLKDTFEKKRDAKIHLKKVAMYRDKWKMSHNLVIFKRTD